MRSASDPVRPWTPEHARAPRAEPRGLHGTVWRYFARTAWRREHAAARGVRGAFWRAVRVVYLATSGFLHDQCLSRAAALTYTTVLSLVPMLALSFAIAKGFGFYETLLRESINPFLDGTFGRVATTDDFVLAPQSFAVDERSHAVRVALMQVLEFVQRTDVSALGWLGLALLVFTVLKLLSSIEGTFNDIWGAQRSRSWVRKLTDYLAMLVVTPMFLFVATGFTAAAKSSAVFVWLHENAHLAGFIEFAFRALPLLALWAGFTFVYMALPNARTRFRSALLGAVVGGTLWQLTLLVHLEFQVGIARYNAIYSGFAALPVFLMWIHFSWVAVLLGAEVCNAHQSEPACTFPSDANEDEPAFREALALRCLGRIGEAFLSGAPAWSVGRLAQDLSLTPRPVGDVLRTLVERGLVSESLADGDHVFLPARDLGSITVKDVLDALRGKSGFDAAPSTAPVDDVVDRTCAGLDRDVHESRHNRTLRSLAEAALRARGEGAGIGREAEDGARAGVAPASPG